MTFKLRTKNTFCIHTHLTDINEYEDDLLYNIDSSIDTSLIFFKHLKTLKRHLPLLGLEMKGANFHDISTLRASAIEKGRLFQMI